MTDRDDAAIDEALRRVGWRHARAARAATLLERHAKGLEDLSGKACGTRTESRDHHVGARGAEVRAFGGREGRAHALADLRAVTSKVVIEWGSGETVRGIIVEKCLLFPSSRRHGLSRHRGASGRGCEGLRDWPREVVEHVVDRCHAGDRLDPEEPAVRVRANHLALDVNRAAAHPGDRPCDLEARVLGLDQDEVLFRPKIFHGRDHLDVETLGLRALKNGEAIPFHSGLHVRDLHEFFVGRRAHRETEKRGYEGTAKDAEWQAWNPKTS